MGAMGGERGGEEGGGESGTRNKVVWWESGKLHRSEQDRLTSKPQNIKKTFFTSTIRHVATSTQTEHQIMIFIAQYNQHWNTSNIVAIISFPGSTPG